MEFYDLGGNGSVDTVGYFTKCVSDDYRKFGVFKNNTLYLDPNFDGIAEHVLKGIEGKKAHQTVVLYLGCGRAV